MPWCVFHGLECSLKGCASPGPESPIKRWGEWDRFGVEQSLADGKDLPQAGRNSIPLVCKRCGVTVARESTTTIRDEKDASLSSPMAGERGLTVARESTTTIREEKDAALSSRVASERGLGAAHLRPNSQKNRPKWIGCSSRNRRTLRCSWSSHPQVRR